MKLFFLLISCFFSTAVLAQETNGPDSLSFCFKQFKVPEGCSAQSEYQVSCDNYSMVWLYLTESMLGIVPDQFVGQMTAQVKVLKKEPITCYLLDNEAKGYLISFKKGDGTAYQLIVWGIANHQPVLVQLILAKEPKRNEDIPSFPAHIIRLTK